MENVAHAAAIVVGGMCYRGWMRNVHARHPQEVNAENGRRRIKQSYGTKSSGQDNQVDLRDEWFGVVPVSLRWHPVAVGEDKKKKGCLRGWVILLVLIVFPMLGWLGSAVVTYAMPKLYESRAVVEALPLDEDSKLGGMDMFVETEAGVMRSGEVMRQAVEKMQLEERWDMEADEAVDAIRERLTVRRLGGSRLLEIRVRHRKMEEAQMLAQAIFEAYCDRRASIRLNRLKEKTKAMRLELQNLDDRKAELRKRHLDIREKVMGEHQRDYNPQEKYDPARERMQQEMDIAKGELEVASERQRRMAEQVAELKAASSMPLVPLVVHELPKVEQQAVSPDIPRNLAGGVIAGVVAALAVLALLVVIRIVTRLV